METQGQVEVVVIAQQISDVIFNPAVIKGYRAHGVHIAFG